VDEDVKIHAISSAEINRIGRFSQGQLNPQKIVGQSKYKGQGC